MKCSYCHKNEAELHIRAIIDGKAQQYHLCRECAKKLQQGHVLPGMPFPLPLNEIASMVEEFLEESNEDEGTNVASHRNDEKDSAEQHAPGPLVLHGRCPQCGCDQEWFAAVKQLGCAYCYTVFREEILTFLERKHPETLHVGSSPPYKEEHPLVELRKLQKRLRRLVDQERYEDAAQIRDEIHVLSSQMEKSHE